MPSLTVYTTPGCVQCRAVLRALDKAGLAYRTVDVTTDPDARDYVMSLGHLALPVVVTAAGEHFSGYRPERIAALGAA